MERKNNILKENRKKMIWEFLLKWKKNYLFSYIKYLLVHLLYTVSSLIYCLLNPVIKCPRIFWVIFFLMMPSETSFSPKSSRTWNFKNFLNEEQQTQIVTIHHQSQDKRSRTLDLLPEPKKRKISSSAKRKREVNQDPNPRNPKRQKTPKNVVKQGIIFHFQNELIPDQTSFPIKIWLQNINGQHEHNISLCIQPNIQFVRGFPR